MVKEQLIARGIRDRQVLNAMRRIPRDQFVSAEHHRKSYDDQPLPIGFDQTISQPYMVALMTEHLGVEAGSKVLEVGTGSGYQAAVLSALGAVVFSIERIPDLAQLACRFLKSCGIENVHVRVGDGCLGWPEEAPFDRILVAASAPRVPSLLLEQLGPGGRLVIPIGSSVSQTLTVLERVGEQDKTSEICGCLFVPLVGSEASFPQGADRQEDSK